jgi:hypothetical protein
MLLREWVSIFEGSQRLLIKYFVGFVLPSFCPFVFILTFFPINCFQGARNFKQIAQLSKPTLLKFIKDLGASVHFDRYGYPRIWALDEKLFTGFIYSSQYTIKMMFHNPGNFCNYRIFELLL